MNAIVRVRAVPRRGAMKLLRYATLALIATVSIGAGEDVEVRYPEGFRRWAHVSSAYIGENNPAAPRYAGIHHINANASALEGYRTGIFPVGAILTFDVHAVKIDKDTIEPTTRKLLDVMEKRPGGWRFVEFDGDSRTKLAVTGAQAEKACAVCHTGAPRDYVFSALQD